MVGDAGLDVGEAGTGREECGEAGVVALPVDGPAELSGVPVGVDGGELLSAPCRAFWVLAADPAFSRSTIEVAAE
ncbi:hypothetical protein [Streptomyces sp. NBC_00154]|uniref:hypothetical protein n=1 Tax=Streptomyces sp. NBC_00154 TaxID=2975670 RepID=UPI0022592A33|nr:hypothetical protein [Streptomyces sp. NBC_00154]MCX5315889.1 hypothetical protein [Streptomyces sp. NBC_00154]